jgi:hypothetical protein
MCISYSKSAESSTHPFSRAFYFALLVSFLLVIPQTCSGYSQTTSGDDDVTIQSEIANEYPSHEIILSIGESLPLAKFSAYLRVGFFDFDSDYDSVMYGVQIETIGIEHAYSEYTLTSVSFTVRAYPFLYVNGEKKQDYWLERNTYYQGSDTFDSVWRRHSFQIGNVWEEYISDVTSVGGVIEIVDLRTEFYVDYETPSKIIHCSPDGVRLRVNFTSMDTTTSTTQFSVESNDDANIDITDSSIMIHLSESIPYSVGEVVFSGFLILIVGILVSNFIYSRYLRRKVSRI